MKFFMAIYSLLKVINGDIYPVFRRMTLRDKFLFLFIHFVDIVYAWHKLPVYLALFYLEIRRGLHQRYNLINVGSSPVDVRYNPAYYSYRTDHGKYNDPFNPIAGSEGTFLGRNMLPSPQREEQLLVPDPMIVAIKLLARRKMVEVGNNQFNMLAASWIQFTIHDWIDHVEDTKQEQLTAPNEGTLIGGLLGRMEVQFMETTVNNQKN
ncbi:hypothetical protein SUGI_0553780 [Cryptomeria japonica]|nr:hypothetical protein SUGI_0553780 [Cryptomeria japonica]